MYANTLGCPFLFLNTEISNISVLSTNNIINYGIRIEEGSSLTFINLTLKDIDSLLPAKNCFSYVATSSMKVEIRDSYI